MKTVTLLCLNEYHCGNMVDGADSPEDSYRSRNNRVARACDRCRIRKIKVSFPSIARLRADRRKCNGKSQCNRCTTDDAICIYTKKRRSHDRAYSKEYVQLLEEQRTALVKGVRELYRRCSVGKGLPELRENDNDNVLIHDLLKALDVLPSQTDDEMETDEGLLEADGKMTSTITSEFSISLSTALSDAQMPGLCKSPTSSSSEIAISPLLPSEKDFEGMMNSLDDGQLQTLELISASKIEGMRCEVMPEPYLVNNSYDFVNMVPGQDYINPRDMGFVSPFQMMHSYPV